MIPQHLLIIGRNDSDLEEISAILSPTYELVMSTKPQEITRQLTHASTQSSTQFSLIFLPIQHGDQDSMRYLKEFRALKPEIPIVVYSEREDIYLVIEAMKRGAQNFISIPFIPEKLMEVIASTLEHPTSRRIGEIDFPLESLDFHERLLLLQERLVDRRMDDIPISVDEIVALFSLDSQDLEFNLETFRHEIETHLEAIKHPASHNRILIIEDEDDYRELLTLFLNKEYVVSNAANGQSALSQLKENPDFDIILLDIFLPDIHGTELISHIKALAPEAEIIIITAFELVDIAVKTFREGAFDFITKPVLKDELLKVIRQSHHKRFLKHILPRIGEDLLQKQLPKSTKIKLLTGILENRNLEGRTLCMKDIYLFFPGLRESHIPGDLPLPKAVVQKGLSQFLSELEFQVSAFSEGEA